MKEPWKEDLFWLVVKLLLAAGILAVMLLWIFGLARCTDNAMTPALKDGDIVLFDRLEKEHPVRGLVVFSKNGKTEVRRIVAKAGDVVEVTEEGLFINGYRQQESDITMETLPYQEGVRYPLTLGEGEYFVLADRRENAEDSRLYGAVSEKEIKGTVIALLRRRGF